MQCVKCNKKIDDEDIFCGYCGINQTKYSKYLEKVNNKVHKEQDREYNSKVKNAQKRLNQLQNSRTKEIQRIENSRWQSIGGKSFSYNMTEGKIIVNNSTYLFSDIKSAEIVKQESFRTVINTTETGKSKSKKHVSLGGGILGAAVAGPVGAVVGGSVLGKTTQKGQSNTVTNSNNIPTCSHIGVNVNLNGFSTEIVLLSSTVDQSSSSYNANIRNAQLIVDKLRNLSQTPVPKKFLKPEEEQSVLDIDKAIEGATKELKIVTDDKPTYEIPESYLK